MTTAELLDWRAGGDSGPGGDPVTGPGGDPVTFDTLYQIRSVTKILMMTVMMMYYDQGKLDFDDPIADYWPEFAKNGKESITIADVLSHRAGISFFTHLADRPRGIDRRVIARAIEGMTPDWKPGEKNGYHGVIIGMISDEIISRLEGKYPPMGDILRREFFEPLGLKDIYLGLPPSEYPRMAKMTVLSPQTEARKRTSDFLNWEEGIQIEQSWVGGVSTAKDLANFMNIFVYEGTYKGKRFFSKEVQELVSKPTNKAGEIDEVLMTPLRWGFGFFLGDSPYVFGTPPHPGALGHTGGSATVAWADPENKLAVAFLCNGMNNSREAFERYRRVGDLVYGALNLAAEKSVAGTGGGDVAAGEMVSVAEGSFEMGDPWNEGGSGERPVHRVTLSAYEIGKYEVTNQEYADMLNWANANPYCQIGYSDGQFVVESRDGHPMAVHPVVEVSWFGAAAYCNWLSERQGLQPCYDTSTWACDFSKNGYHLPTEAQWERAAAWSGSSHSRYGNGSDTLSPSNATYYSSNPLGLSTYPYTSPVGYHNGASSPAGCYDMSGNVWEWCHDWYGGGYYGGSRGTDPEGPDSGSRRVRRGGSWDFYEYNCRSAFRYYGGPSNTYDSVGFRIAR
jgi:formylglycine-generating enzyme required for sulfatase activity